MFRTALFSFPYIISSRVQKCIIHDAALAILGTIASLVETPVIFNVANHQPLFWKKDKCLSHFLYLI